MKTLIALLLAALLTACSSGPVVTQVENDTPPLETAIVPAMKLMPAEPVVQEEVISYAVETIEYGGMEQTGDGEPLITYSFDIPRLTAYREDGTPIQAEDEAPTDAELHALAVTQAFNEKFEAWTSLESLSGLAADAAADLAFHKEEGIEWHGGYTLGLSCTIYQTDYLISIASTHYSYTGGAHPNTVHLGWNFDLEEGVFFGPELLGDGAGLQEAVTAEIIRQANIPLGDGTVPAEWYWENYEEIAANWSCCAVIFDDRGMTVIFSAYEIAAYAMGPQEFLLPYDFLEPYLSTHGREILGLESAEGTIQNMR